MRRPGGKGDPFRGTTVQLSARSAGMSGLQMMADGYCRAAE
jgi:hypothetical protein